MNNYKPTITGILVIVSALASAGLLYEQGKSIDIPTTVSAIMAGVGLLLARDSKSTDLTRTEQIQIKAALPSIANAQSPTSNV